MDKKAFFDELINDKKERNLLTNGENAAPEESDNLELAEEKQKKTTRAKKNSTVSSDENNEEKFSQKTAEGQLAIDMYQTPTEIIIKTAIAGIDQKKMNIFITNDLVEIRGSRLNDEIIEEKNYFYNECFWGNFSRSIILPVEVEADKSAASLKNGILTIRLPKSERTKTKKISIKPE